MAQIPGPSRAGLWENTGPLGTVVFRKPIQMVRGATMAASSVNDRNDADLAVGYRAALRRAAAAAREAALLEDLLMARGASAITGDETVEVETMIVGAGRRSLELHETSLSIVGSEQI
jgi:hypothetical protein